MVFLLLLLFLSSAVVKVFITISLTPCELLTWFFSNMAVKMADSGIPLPKFKFLFRCLTVWPSCVEQGILCWIIAVLPVVTWRGETWTDPNEGSASHSAAMLVMSLCATFSEFLNLSTTCFLTYKMGIIRVPISYAFIEKCMGLFT